MPETPYRIEYKMTEKTGKQPDLRVQKTYSALIFALFNLLKSKRFEDITVNELCETAQVRRATFYKHFEDKYQFFSFAARQMLDSFNMYSAAVSDPDNPVSKYVATVENLFDFTEKNQALVRSFYRSSMYPVLMEILRGQLEENIRNHVETDTANGKVWFAQNEIIVQIFTGSLISLAQWWSGNAAQVSKTELMASIESLLSRIVR